MNQIFGDNNRDNKYPNGNNAQYRGYHNNTNYYDYRPYQPVITQNSSNYYYNKKSNRSKASIETVARVFSVLLILLGIMIIGQSVMALSNERKNERDTPIVSVEKMGKEVTIAVKTEYPVKGLEYCWNDGEKTKLEGSETNQIVQTIEVPNGNNILNIVVTDCYGHKTYYNRQYIYESSDTLKPVIEIAITGIKLRIKVTDETKLSYVEYKWNNEEATRINIDQNQVEQEIEVKQGQNELTVIAVDWEENKTTRTEKVIGDTKPEVSILTEGSNIVVNAKDDEGISKVIVTIDGEEKDSGEDEVNQKEVTAKIPVSVGTHEIKATVINVNGLENSKEITANI